MVSLQTKISLWPEREEERTELSVKALLRFFYGSMKALLRLYEGSN
jgi:hypothetical protein